MVVILSPTVPFVEPGTIGGMPSVWFILRDPNPFLREFRRKSRKTPNDYVDKRDLESNPAPSVYQFRAQNRSTIGGAQICVNVQ